MKAIIMAGGLGTRLRPLTNELPKPMVPIIDKPIMLYIVDLLRSYGFTDIGVTLNYKPDSIISYFRDGSQFGVRLTYFIESSPLGTAGSVKNAADFLSEDFLVMSGDSFTNIDLDELRAFHFKKNALFTLACKYYENTSGFGVLQKERGGKITGFVEKPEGTAAGLVNTGIYMINKTVLRLIPDGYYDFGKNLLPRLVGNGLYARETDGYWSDIGSLPSYYSANYFVATNMAR
ncbi:MAG: nucleotidyltransferase family protein [Clostridiales bacterium]|jgi:NDP-sugar pyrophosphorylase family protein|nr:nucleotidyltransferase family protein [Clostridiales bacterium]